MRLFVLRKELLQFLQTKDHKFQKILEDENFILHLAYLSDIFGVMNHFNCSLQGPESSIIDFSIKLTAFTRKLDLRIKNIENKQFGIFENVVSLAGQPSIAFGQEIINHLLLLKDEIKQYFFNDGNAQVCTYIRNPFTVKPGDLPVGTDEQEELIDLQCDEGAQEKFKTHKLAEFWLNVSPLLSGSSEKCNSSASHISNDIGMRTRIFYFSYKQVEDKKSSRKPRAQFPMFCKQNISSTCKTSRRKASAVIALTYEYLLVDKLSILLVYVYVHVQIS